MPSTKYADTSYRALFHELAVKIVSLSIEFQQVKSCVGIGVGIAAPRQVNIRDQ